MKPKKTPKPWKKPQKNPETQKNPKKNPEETLKRYPKPGPQDNPKILWNTRLGNP